MNLMKMVENTQNHNFLLLLKWWSISVWTAHQQSKQYSWNLTFTAFSGTYVSHVQSPKMPKPPFLTILVLKIKFCDHLLIVTISLLLLGSGLIFLIWPLEIGFQAILYLKCQKMAKHGNLWSRPLSKCFKILKTNESCYCGSGESFQSVTLINQSTKKQYSLNLTFT